MSYRVPALANWHIMPQLLPLSPTVYPTAAAAVSLPPTATKQMTM